MEETFLGARFEIDSEERASSFWVITAYNPDAQVVDAALNGEADAALAAELDRRGLRRFRVTGGSPDGTHVEPGWGVECYEAEAMELGRQFRQHSLFFFDGERIELVNCGSGERHSLPPLAERVVCPRKRRIFARQARHSINTI